MADAFDIHKACGLLLKDRKLLVEKSGGKDIYVIPGGRIEAGETPQETLTRELLEEFTIQTDATDFEFVGTYLVRNAKIQDSTVKMETFIVKKWEGDIKKDHEIEDAAWVNYSNLSSFNLSPFALKIVLPLLKDKDLIN